MNDRFPNLYIRLLWGQRHWGPEFRKALRDWIAIAKQERAKLPPDLERALRDQSIVVPQDGAVFASMMTPEMEAQLAEWANASSDTPSSLSAGQKEAK